MFRVHAGVRPGAPRQPSSTLQSFVATCAVVGLRAKKPRETFDVHLELSAAGVHERANIHRTQLTFFFQFFLSHRKTTLFWRSSAANAICFCLFDLLESSSTACGVTSEKKKPSDNYSLSNSLQVKSNVDRTVHEQTTSVGINPHCGSRSVA